jgi:hypothetical protein
VNQDSSGMVSHFLRPHNLIAMTVLLSLMAWLYPDVPGLRRGFNDREIVSVNAVLILILWYAFLILVSFLGFHVGRLIPPRYRDREADRAPLNSDLPYLAFTTVAVFGILYTLAALSAKGVLIAYLANIGNSSENMLKEALSENYSIGPMSLRYVAVISGAIALYRIMRFAKVSFLDGVNIFAVVVVSFLSGRMLLLWTLCGTAGAFTLQDAAAKRRALKLMWGLVPMALVLLWG